MEYFSDIIALLALIVSVWALVYTHKANKRQDDLVTLKENKHRKSILPEFQTTSDPQHDYIPDLNHSLEFGKKIRLVNNRAISLRIEVMDGCRFTQTEYKLIEPQHEIYYVVDFTKFAKQNIEMYKLYFKDIEGNSYLQVATGSNGHVSLSLPTIV